MVKTSSKNLRSPIDPPLAIVQFSILTKRLAPSGLAPAQRSNAPSLRVQLSPEYRLQCSSGSRCLTQTALRPSRRNSMSKLVFKFIGHGVPPLRPPTEHRGTGWQLFVGGGVLQTAASIRSRGRASRRHRLAAHGRGHRIGEFDKRRHFSARAATIASWQSLGQDRAARRQLKAHNALSAQKGNMG